MGPARGFEAPGRITTSRVPPFILRFTPDQPVAVEEALVFEGAAAIPARGFLKCFKSQSVLCPRFAAFSSDSNALCLYLYRWSLPSGSSSRLRARSQPEDVANTNTAEPSI